jgi:hypothetical protein
MAKTKTPSKPAQLNLKIRIPHVILDLRGADPKVAEALAGGLEELGARFHVLGNGLKSVPHVFSLEEALEVGHMWVVFGGQLPSEFAMIIERGIVPLMRTGLHSKADNYNPIEESGNAFLFDKESHWQIYSALVRALENFNFSYDWENIRAQGRCLLERA